MTTISVLALIFIIVAAAYLSICDARSERQARGDQRQVSWSSDAIDSAGRVGLMMLAAGLVTVVAFVNTH